MKKLLLLILTISIFSCTKDDGLSSAEIEAIEFLNKNPLTTVGLHSEGLRALKLSMGLPYELVDVTWTFEVTNNKNFIQRRYCKKKQLILYKYF